MRQEFARQSPLVSLMALIEHSIENLPTNADDPLTVSAGQWIRVK